MSIKKIRPIIFGVLVIVSLLITSCGVAPQTALDDQAAQLQSQIEELQSQLEDAVAEGMEAASPDPELQAQLDELKSQLECRTKSHSSRVLDNRQ